MVKSHFSDETLQDEDMGPEDNDGEELENEDGIENALTNPENESSDPIFRKIIRRVGRRLIRRFRRRNSRRRRRRFG